MQKYKTKHLTPMKKLLLILTSIFFFSFTSGEDIVLLSGNLDFLKQPKSIYVEFDYTKMSIDALSTEEGFIQYRIKKEKEDKDGKSEADVRNDWEKDKKYFSNTYIEQVKKVLKDYPAAFNNDNPKSDYKLTIALAHMDTGNPMKKSSVKYKMIYTETTTGKQTAVVAIPTTWGVAMGVMAPTVGMRISTANYYTLAGFEKFLKKNFKVK